MSASNAPALRVIAQQLLAVLESYEQDVGRMVTTWPDAKYYVAVNRQMDQSATSARRCRACIPRGRSC